MSLRILAFNTSTEICSVALLIDDIIYACCGLISRQHEREVLLIIDRLLLDVGITLKSLDFLVVCRGPGSFVGVRIGISIAQGLALGVSLPVIEVSSLEVLAQGIWRLMKAKQVLATINARLGELYVGCYYQNNCGVWSILGSESVIAFKDMSVLFSKLYGDWVLVGTGWEVYSFLLSNEMGSINIIRKVLFPSALDMLPLAMKKWERGEILTVNKIRPVYLCQTKWDK